MAVLPLRIQVRRDQDSLFNAENPLLLEGEIAFSIDKNKAKIGDGINRWQQLDYLDDELTARVDVLTADATVEGSVDAKVAAEAALRIEADDALAARLDTLEGDDSVADSVDGKIMVEAMARQTADEALQGVINAVQVDVDQNKIDSNSADGILQQNIDALTTTVNANEADSDAADAALQAAIDAEIARVDALVATDMWLFPDQSAFPSATLNHGRIVHSHADASMFYAHGGTWHKIEREDEAQAARDTLESIVNQNELASISRDGVLQTNLDNVEAAKANVGDVYTQTEVDTALALKANAADLTNVDNTSDADKPISTATQAALDDKANSADVYTQSEVTALVDAKADAADVSNVDNTSDADKPISTATQAALDTKADAATTYDKTEVDNAIQAVQADVDQNESDADAAIAAVQADVLEITDGTTAAAVATALNITTYEDNTGGAPGANGVAAADGIIVINTDSDGGGTKKVYIGYDGAFIPLN